MEKYETLIKRSKITNITIFGIADFLLTLGFVPYVVLFLVSTGIIDASGLVSTGALMNVCGTAGDLSLIVFLVTTITVLVSGHSSLFLGFYYSGLGLLYYVIEIIVYFLSITFLKQAPENVAILLPNNYLFSIAAFIYIFYFLFSEPKFKKLGKIKKAIFRSCLLIPLTYIIGSYVLSLFDSLGTISIPGVVSPLLSGQYFSHEIIGILIILAFYILKKKQKTVVAVPESATPSDIGQSPTPNGKGWSVASFPEKSQNAVIILSISVMALLDLILYFSLPTKRNALELGESMYAFVLVPLFFFYNNDNSLEAHPKLSKFFDWYYTGLYIFLAIVYFIITVCVINLA